MSSAFLTAPQLRALFDILVHHETYAEVEYFKNPEAIDRYGYPFNANFLDGGDTGGGKSYTPLLQLLLTRVILPVPGVRDLSPEFWNVKFRGIMLRLCEADLSESYDKGTLGSRKRLATAASVIHEGITRGLLAGVLEGRGADLQNPYNHKTASGLVNAWHVSVHQLVYGNLVDELFDHLTTTNDFEAHSPAIKAAVDYAIIHIATLLHYIFVLSAEGPYLLKLLENVHNLIPYSVIAQTLRVGNAATMMSSLFRLVLAKVSVGAVTNWLGLTQNADDGMNLLQRIISMTLEWDAGDFRKAVEKIKKTKNRVSDECLAVVNRHTGSDRTRHDSVRETSQKQKKSIAVAILESEDGKLVDTLTDKQHLQLLESYSAQLAIRDREKIVDALCRQSPDFTTSVIKDVLAVFEPMIREIHANVDLRKHVCALEKLLTDLIKTSKPKKANNDKNQKDFSSTPPSVDDYVEFLRRNRYMLFDYLHDVAKGCPELREAWRAWAKETVSTFQQNEISSKVRPSDTKVANVSQARNEEISAGSIDGELQRLFDTIPAEKRIVVLAEINAHAQYLGKLKYISEKQMQRILCSASGDKPEVGPMSGPGVYLSQWQSLLDKTLITPESKQGPPRTGKDVKGVKASGKTEAVATKDSWDPVSILTKEESSRPEAPDTTTVISQLGTRFKELVAEISSKDLPS